VTRVQRRRSISLRVSVSDALQTYCIDNNVSASSVIESLLADITGVASEPRPRVQRYTPQAGIAASRETIAAIDGARSQHRTERGEIPSRRKFLDERINAWLDRQGAK
jgi:hypothetical protein